MSRSDSRKRARRKRQERAVLIVCITVVLVVAAGIASALLRLNGRQGQAGEGQSDTPQAQPAAGTLDSEGKEAGTEEAGPEKVFISLGKDQVRKGDLVLINGVYAYDFDANKDLALVNIKDTQTYDYPVSKTEFEVASHIMASLDEMVRDCDAAMGTAYTGISSAYRTYDYQRNVWQEMAELYGESYSEKYVANPGYSEHHTGLAVDLGIIYDDGSEGSFSESENAVWMKNHCADYGFIRRYSEDKIEITGISNEAWHFRYVGLPHARYMADHNLCLEEYIDYLRDNTSPSAPLTVETADGKYGVYFTSGESFEEPEKAYTVSGNNVDGCIITFEL